MLLADGTGRPSTKLCTHLFGGVHVMHVAGWQANLCVVHIRVEPEVGGRHVLISDKTPAVAAVCRNTKLTYILAGVFIEGHVCSSL